MSRMTRLFACWLTLAPLPSIAQESVAGSTPRAAGARPPTAAADWGKWEILGSGSLAPDGRWVAYDFRRVSGGSELRYRLVGASATRDASAAGPADGPAAEKSVRNGTGPTFARNSRFLLYAILPDTAVDGRAGVSGATATGDRGGRGGGGTSAVNRNSVGIVDLRSGAATVLADIESFSINTLGTHVALRRYAPSGRPGRGADLVVRDLEQGGDVTLGNVAEFAWNDNGSLLAMTTDVEGKTGNGVQVLTVATGAIRPLDAADVQYTNLQWRARSSDLVAFRGITDSSFVDTAYAVLAWRALDSATSPKIIYDFTTDARFPAGMRVASYRRPQWSDDGSTLFFGIASREPKVAPSGRGEVMPARVEVWHWKDLREYHQQDRQAAQDRTKTHLVAWHMSPSALVRLADDTMEEVQLSDNRTTAIASDEAPYFKEGISGRPYRDVYRIDVTTGQRQRLITRTPFAPVMSPNGRFVLYVQGGHWWSLDMSTGKITNLTGAIKGRFVNVEDDHPLPERRPYGLAGFTPGERSVLLYDRYDLWQVNTDGTAPRRLTQGREDSTVYRVARLTGARNGGARGAFGFAEPLALEERWIDLAKPIFLTATGEFSKKSGYSRISAGELAQRLLWLDKSVTGLEKARDAEAYIFAEQTYAESPNFFVSGPMLADAKPVSHTNAFQSEYAWGKQLLMPYVNRRGDKLQMMLTYPADYQPGKKYPMVVYYYEKLSQGFHQYVIPSDRSTYNTTVFSQNGYFVLRPDVVFQPRNAGFSGLDCVTSAVKAAMAAVPSIDAARVGNMGHSWGGYQSAFYAVHGHGLFAATIAGAPLTDFVSFYGYTSYNSGMPETGHFETGQERMQVSLWEDPQAYIRNSTIFAVDSLRTPLLLEEGDADGNVNYWQSTELYNFGRRLGKNVVYLIYNDENHGVARPESQRDYHKRQLEWFAHYLKGDAAASWITNGESYLTRQKLLKDAGAASAPAPKVVPDD